MKQTTVIYKILGTGRKREREILEDLRPFSRRRPEAPPRGAYQICSYGQNLLQHFQTFQSTRVDSTSYQDLNITDSRWKPPLEGYLKLNVDAAYTEDGAGLGLIIRDHKGEIAAVIVEHVAHCFDAEHAETLSKALEFAKEYKISHFVLESDALSVVNKINGKEADLSITRHIIEGIRVLSGCFSDLKINHVNRKLNKPAHEASKIALHVKGKCIWFSNFPMPVMLAAHSDFV